MFHSMKEKSLTMKNLAIQQHSNKQSEPISIRCFCGTVLKIASMRVMTPRVILGQFHARFVSFASRSSNCCHVKFSFGRAHCKDEMYAPWLTGMHRERRSGAEIQKASILGNMLV